MFAPQSDKYKTGGGNDMAQPLLPAEELVSYLLCGSVFQLSWPKCQPCKGHAWLLASADMHLP